MKITYSSATHPGTNRVNQDRMYSNVPAGVFMIADGCGGCEGNSAIAAQICKEVFEFVYEPKKQSDSRFDYLLDFAHRSDFDNTNILSVSNLARQVLNGFCEANDESIDCAFAALRATPKGLTSITAGDVLVYSLTDSPKLIHTPHNYPGTHTIYRSLKTDTPFEAQFTRLKPHEKFFMCSDGFMELEDPDKLIADVKELEASIARDQIQDLIKTVTEPIPDMPLDNISFIILDIEN